MSDSRSRKSKVRNRPNEAWATDTVIISEAGDGDGAENDTHDIIFGLRNALLASGLIWALLIVLGFAVFG